MRNNMSFLDWFDKEEEEQEEQVQPEQPKVETKPEWNPLVKQYLIERGLTDDSYKAAQAEASKQKDSTKWGQAFDGIGQAIAGKAQDTSYWEKQRADIDDKTTGALDKKRKQAFEDLSLEQSLVKADKEKVLQDPNSKESVSFRNHFKSLYPTLANAYGDKFNEITASDKDIIFDTARLKEATEARKAQYQLTQQNRQDALAVKVQEKADKKKQAVTEIQDRYNNIKDSIGSLKNMVNEYGTQEMLGPQNKQMDQYITAIATDMAKLVDPQSVARESEVASFKKMLFEPGFWQRESSIQGVLDNFSGMVDKRLANAYAVRGIEMPEDIKNQSSAKIEKPASESTVKMKTPDGKIRMIPQSQVQAALDNGAELADKSVAQHTDTQKRFNQ